jgi:tetratricopeptide (TPR) repeat protein
MESSVLKNDPGPCLNQKNILDQAHALFYEKRYSEAIPLYKKFVEPDLRDFLVFANLGIALRNMGQHALSAIYLKRADELCPNSPGLLRHYAYSLALLSRKEEALEAFSRSLRLAPNDFNTRSLYAFTLRSFDMNEESLFQYEAAHKLEPQNTDIIWQRTDVNLRLGRFKEGWKDFEVRWQLDDDQPFLKAAQEEKTYPSRRWTGEDLKGKTILIYAEQGFGDTILCSRYIPMVKARGARVIFRTALELYRLFQNVRGIDLLVTTLNIQERIDYHVPLMSLPGLFGTEVNSIPSTTPLHVPETLPAEVAQKLNFAQDSFKVGIVWAGRSTFGGNYKRAVSFERFLPLAEIPGVQLYSLQKGPAEQELVDCGAQIMVQELGPHLNDFADTAAVLNNLDLVIMTDSAVAHLAGSMGCPVWNLLSTGAYWVYLQESEDSPWYPSMRLFRQPEPGDWDSVFEKVTLKNAGKWHWPALQGEPLAQAGQMPGKVKMALPDQVTISSPQKTVSEQADLFFSQGRYSEVVALYQEALSSNFNDATVWGNLGIALRHLNNYAAAAACLKRASELDPKSFAILRHYAICLMFLNHKEECLRVFADVVEALPKDFLARSHYAFALREFDRHSEALEQFMIARLLKPESKETKWDISKTHLALGHYKEAWKDFEVRWGSP